MYKLPVFLFLTRGKQDKNPQPRTNPCCGPHKKKVLVTFYISMHHLLSLALYNLCIVLFPSLFLPTQFFFFLLFFLDNGYFQVSFCFILTLLSLLGMQQCCSQGVSQGLPRVSVSQCCGSETNSQNQVPLAAS